MSQSWALCLSRGEAGCAARLRQTPLVEVCEIADKVWLRGPYREEIAEQIHAMPTGVRFRVLDDGQLIPWGARVPQGRLPAGNWRPLAGWFELTLPTATVPATLPSRVGLRLVRDLQERTPSLLILSIERWLRYAETAPQVRLDGLQFVANESGRVLVRGTPAPPLAGELLVEESGVAVPAGWWWSPAVDGPVLRALLGLEAGELAILRLDGCVDRIAAGDFVRATRSAVRQTAAAATQGSKL